jgi:hypothetical protein
VFKNGDLPAISSSRIRKRDIVVESVGEATGFGVVAPARRAASRWATPWATPLPGGRGDDALDEIMS